LTLWLAVDRLPVSHARRIINLYLSLSESQGDLCKVKLVMGKAWIKDALRKKWVRENTQWVGLTSLDLVVLDGLDRSSL
jgi:hypothetical protein